MDFSMNKGLFCSKGIGIVLQLHLYFSEQKSIKYVGKSSKDYKKNPD